ncbi:nucleoside-diphosphate kinase [Candidatus Falkowbacteria bacterium CG_4_8_14_3_um_filter_36_11]|nr:MAG: nucleoside-diphosphate kinase [Candidatus Falkowbacteria bacterium CG_4_8_14_3_um_filter_36_11]
MSQFEKTLIMLKPEAFRRNLVDKIISQFTSKGLKIVAARTIDNPSRELLELHYSSDEFIRLNKLHIRERVITYCSSGRIMVVLFEGENAIELVRKIIGDRNPRLSGPGTIRSCVDDSFEDADARGEAMRDLIHGPRSKEEAMRQIQLWFEEKV